MLEKRKSMPLELKEEYDRLIKSHLMKYLEPYQSIGFFLSFGFEINTFLMIEELLNEGKKVSVPKVEGETMKFYEIKDFKSLKKSNFGVLEPINGNAVLKSSLDIIIVPLLAYNQSYYRVGYGGGYYDRYLKNYTKNKIGIAYSFQNVNEEFQEIHDVPCDFIINERGIE